jgi:hypothetical protein
MSNRARLGLIVAAALVAVAAFLVLKPDDESKKADDSAATTVEHRSTSTATVRSVRRPAEEIVIRDEAPVGGVARIKASKGDVVRLVVKSDKGDEIHLHGYDIEKKAAPGMPARFRFKADVEGVFEIESHTAEDAGRNPLMGRLVVEP